MVGIPLTEKRSFKVSEFQSPKDSENTFRVFYRDRPHVQDVREPIRRIVGIVGARLFQNVQSCRLPTFKMSWDHSWIV